MNRQRAMGRTKALAIVSAAAGIVALAWIGRAQLPEPAPRRDVEREIRTLGRVLEEKLRRAELLPPVRSDMVDFFGDRNRIFAAGGPRIGGEYIPSVGAIFRVGVDFPLSERPEAGGRDERREGEEPEDLWEKHSGGAIEPGQAPAALAFGPPSDAELGPALAQAMTRLTERLDERLARLEGQSPEGVHARIGEAIEGAFREATERIEEAHREGEISDEEREEALEAIGEAREEVEAAIPAVEVIPAVMAQIVPTVIHGVMSGLAAAQAGPLRLSMRRTEPYDAAKVDKLRRTILEALAEYGHRMEHLEDEERIVVVVESGAGPRGMMLQAPPRRPADFEDIRLFRRGAGDAEDSNPDPIVARVIQTQERGERARRDAERLREQAERLRGDAERIRDEQERRAREIEIDIRRRLGGPGGIGILAGPPDGRPGERYVLSIRKAELKTRTTAEAIADKVEEHRY